MGRLLVAILFWIGATAAMAGPNGSGVIGRTSMFNNDYLGDGHDRWRTGSYIRGVFIGPDWAGQLPEDGYIYEFRMRGEAIAPVDVSRPDAEADRPFVGMSSVGLHRHFRRGARDFRLGADLIVIGPQSGVSSLVEEAHDLLGFKTVRATRGQLGNDVIPTLSGEVSRTYGGTARLPFQIRPFAALQIGVETYARVGVDSFFGAGVSGDLLSRDHVTGQIMTAARRDNIAGLTPMLGADIAYVHSSYYLPPSRGAAPKSLRARVRGGLRHVGANHDVFVGLTWLGPEFVGQNGGQILGSVSVDTRF